ncbi:hypothetical protein [Bradyrhizobium sp. 141]|uniref:hypothetical protein n=1 Tax=Bradyrhizobium sp. 141 TaxID=2782617 RepID=UPI001FFAE32E|nr:hypothetical protein [Bradyrhizobium sp. 141]MCK1718241.1 hypothetical protein [Bradyrhizobium sp. 141]
MTSVVDPLQVSRFLQIYDAAAVQKGIKLSIGLDFYEYVSITRRLPTKRPTEPCFRPDRSVIKSGEGYWMLGVDSNNEVALVEAARLYDLSQSNFAEHLESLKLFYSDPSKHAHPQDSCTCTAPSAKKITGKVAYHGDFWLRKDFRRQGIPKIMAGILRGVSFAMWAPDFVCGLAERWMLEKGVLAQYGHTHHELGGAILHLVEENIVEEDLLVWLTREELRKLIFRHDRSDLALAL